MTKIYISKHKIEITGHSGYSDLGTDIVCASISSVCFYFIKLDNLEYEETEDSYIINTQNASKKNISAFKNFMERLQDQYSENVRLYYENTK